jgi:nitrite reductase (NADH) large subunit
VKRVGIDVIKARIVEDNAERSALAERFRFSQQFFQTDPWEERVRGKDADEFRPMQHAMPLAAE